MIIDLKVEEVLSNTLIYTCFYEEFLFNSDEKVLPRVDLQHSWVKKG